MWSKDMKNCDVAIVGAGPYGLSIAAHLTAMGVNFRIFGNPMEFWLNHMPKGMHLKSEGFASSLYDPDSVFTLEAYCKEAGLPYGSIGRPVPLEVFSAYGVEFQKRFAPQLECEKVALVQRSAGGFQVTLQNGEVFKARRVVVAVGLTYFEHVPDELKMLPEEFVTHSSRHREVDQFKGKDVAIVGAGASALDLAALLHEAGASVQVIARVPRIRFHDPPDNLEPSWLDKLRTPVTGIGTGWKLFLCANLPVVFRLMPEKFRVENVRRILGPAPCWFTKEHVVGKVGMNLGSTIDSVSVKNGKISLQLKDSAGATKTLNPDHIIAATGYKPDLRRLTFLDPGIVSALRCVDKSPALSSTFESTEPNLYFVGITAANTFGPLLRFAFGAGFAAPRLARHLMRTASSHVDVHVSAPAIQSTARQESPDSMVR